MPAPAPAAQVETAAAWGEPGDPTPLPAVLRGTLSTIARPRAAGGGALLPLALAALALGIWISALPSINLQAMNDLGVISVLPGRTLVSLALLTLSFVLALRRPRPRTSVVLALAGTEVVMLFGLTAFIEEIPRFSVAWRHAGVTEYILRHHAVDPRIDAYFNWPTFFSLCAFGVEVTGAREVIGFARWAPIAYNLLYLCPLVLIFRSLTTDERTVWLAVWLFYASNWIGQDYLSPQGLAFFLNLVVAGILLAWFRRGPQEGAPPGVTAAVRASLLVAIVLLFGTVVGTHQLTPFAMLAGAAGLVLVRRCTARTLPVLMAVLTVAWLSYMAAAFLAGHLRPLLEAIAGVGDLIDQNLTGRLRGSPHHVVVVRLRLAMTACVWALAAAGAARRFLGGHRDVACAALAAAPFPLLVLQPYGGEMLLRVYLFALPYVAFFVAGLFAVGTAGRRWGWTRVAALAAATLALTGGFLLTRFGNERVNQYTRDELSAVEYLYRVAPAGARILAGSNNLPWKFRDYERYDYDVLSRHFDPLRTTPSPSDIARLLQAPRLPGAYLVITRRQKAYLDLLGYSPPGWLDRVEQELLSSPSMEMVFENADARVFVVREGGDGAR